MSKNFEYTLLEHDETMEFRFVMPKSKFVPQSGNEAVAYLRFLVASDFFDVALNWNGYND